MKALAILCLLAATAVAQPDAEKLYTEGQQAYDAKDYVGALAKWEKSYELSKLPALVFNIAQAYRLKGDCTQAVAHYKKFIEAIPTSAERPDADGFIKDLSPCKAPPPPIDKPKPIGKPIVTTDTGHGKRIAAFALGGAGIVGIAVGAVFGRKASSLADEVKSDCADGMCNWDDIKQKDADGHSAETKQWISLGVGTAALGTAVVLYMLGNKQSSVAVTPHGEGATVSWTHAF